MCQNTSIEPDPRFTRCASRAVMDYLAAHPASVALEVLATGAYVLDSQQRKAPDDNSCTKLLRILTVGSACSPAQLVPAHG